MVGPDGVERLMSYREPGMCCPSYNELLKSSLLAVVGLLGTTAWCETSITVLPQPGVASRNAHYVSNRPPLQPNPLIKLPLGAIEPAGWLQETLRRQRDGLAGNLPRISAWLAQDENAWLSADGRGKWGWEEEPYWLRGAVSLGQLLDDASLIAETQVWIEAVLGSQRDDGNFGPLRVFGDDDSHDLWGNMVMLSCLETYYETSRDPRVIELMTKYFRFQSAIADEKMLTHFWQYYRGGDNLQTVYWLYNRTGDEWLLDLAAKVHRNTAPWDLNDDLPNWHGVNVAEAFNEPAVFYQQSREPGDLAAAYRNFTLVRQQYGQAPGGMFAADENARVGYDDPRQAIETCAVVEQLTSDQYLLAITGDTFWTDHIEELAFNTLPAAFTPDYRALRYLTSPNLVSSDRHDHAPGVDVV